MLDVAQKIESLIIILTIDNGNTAAELIMQQEARAVAELDQKIDDITSAGQITLDECPATTLDPEFERCAVHRIINEEQIVDVLEDDEEGDQDDGYEEIDVNVQVKPKYTTTQKLECFTRFLDILDQEDDLDSKILDALPDIEKIRKQFYHASQSKQTTLTDFFQQQ